MKNLVLWCALALAPVGFVAPAQAQNAPNLLKAPLKWPTIKQGVSDNDTSFDGRVAAVQYLLRTRGFYKGRADGDYGPKTIAAVKAFQRKNGLKADGILGPRTLPKLVIPVKRGSKGDAVRATQILVRGASGHEAQQPNLNLDVDGTFGKETQNAVGFAQSAQNDFADVVKVDGIMGSRSWCLLVGGKAVGEE